MNGENKLGIIARGDCHTCQPFGLRFAFCQLHAAQISKTTVVTERMANAVVSALHHAALMAGNCRISRPLRGNRATALHVVASIDADDHALSQAPYPNRLEFFCRDAVCQFTVLSFCGFGSNLLQIVAEIQFYLLGRQKRDVLAPCRVDFALFSPAMTR